MIDPQTVALELSMARQARIDAELACCEVEELAEEIRRAHIAFMRLLMTKRENVSSDVLVHFRAVSSVPQYCADGEMKSAA